MNRNRFFQYPVAAVMLLILLLVSLIGQGVYAKYVQDTSLGATITVEADIGTVTVVEHQAQKQADGTYILLDGSVDNVDGQDVQRGHVHVNSNSYILLPGVDVPKDPVVVVDKPNDLMVYIYLMIDEAPEDEAVTWVMEDCWERIEVKSNSGQVYVYTGNDKLPDVVTADAEIPVLKNNQIIVSQFLLQPDGSEHYTSQTITFTAYMYQVASGGDVGNAAGSIDHAISVYSNNQTSGT